MFRADESRRRRGCHVDSPWTGSGGTRTVAQIGRRARLRGGVRAGPGRRGGHRQTRRRGGGRARRRRRRRRRHGGPPGRRGRPHAGTERYQERDGAGRDAAGLGRDDGPGRREPREAVRRRGAATERRSCPLALALLRRWRWLCYGLQEDSSSMQTPQSLEEDSSSMQTPPKSAETALVSPNSVDARRYR